MSVSMLVVDYEPDMADRFHQRFRRKVRDSTFVIYFANSGEVALETLGDGFEPQLIVIRSDINIPVMDGLMLLRGIKRRAVIMVTFYGDEDRRRWPTECGAFEFVTKPVDFDPLKTQPLRLSAGPG